MALHWEQENSTVRVWVLLGELEQAFRLLGIPSILPPHHYNQLVAYLWCISQLKDNRGSRFLKVISPNACSFHQLHFVTIGMVVQNKWHICWRSKLVYGWGFVTLKVRWSWSCWFYQPSWYNFDLRSRLNHVDRHSRDR